VIALAPEWMARPEAVVLPAGASNVVGAGTGFAAGDGALKATLGAVLLRADAAALPHAADLAWLGARAWSRGEAIAADQLEPAYLRDKVALTTEEQKKGRAPPA
jgi:tRNA threonylcarbamoyladenosine biosynthesis protein TsaB